MAVPVVPAWQGSRKVGLSIFVSLASLFGFSAGFIMLRLVRDVKLTLTPTSSFPQRVLLRTKSRWSDLLAYYLLIAAPWIVIGFYSIGFGLFCWPSGPVRVTKIFQGIAFSWLAGKTQGTTFLGNSVRGLRPKLFTFRKFDKGKEQLDAVVAHEMAHIRRRDIINMWLWTLNVALCSYLPGKFAWKSYSLELEKETDRLAIKAIGSPFPLAEALIGVAKLCSPVKVAANLSSGGLEERTMAVEQKEKLVAHKSLADALLHTVTFDASGRKKQFTCRDGISECRRKMIEGKMMLYQITGDARKPYGQLYPNSHKEEFET